MAKAKKAAPKKNSKNSSPASRHPGGAGLNDLLSEPIRIGVIGGSGLYDLPEFKRIGEKNIATPFGKPSSPYQIFEIDGIRIAFLSRHGKGHLLNPSELPARANIYGFKSLGVDKLISISAVGSLQSEIAPEHFVVPDQIIDRTKRGNATFFEGGLVGHVSFAEPYCTELSKMVYEELKSRASTTVHRGGTYVCMEGPAFSTRAESLLYKSWGASVIGMTALPEAKLAREAEMSYAAIAMSTDYDCWKIEEKAVTVDQVVAHMAKNTENVKKALPAIVHRVAAYTEVQHRNAAEFAFISAKDRIPSATKKKIALLYQKYF